MGLSKKDREWLLGKEEADRCLIYGVTSFICLISLYMFILVPVLGAIGLSNGSKAKKHGFTSGRRTAGMVFSSIGVAGFAAVVAFLVSMLAVFAS